MTKKLLVLLLSCAVLLPGMAWAADGGKVAIFPFQIFSGEPLGYLRDDLQKMLKERLAAMGKEVADLDNVNRALAGANKPLDLTLARQLAGQLGADWAIYGSLTKIGGRLSLDARVLDVLGMQRPQSVFVEGAGLDELPALSDRLARELLVYVSGREKVAKIQVEGNRRIEADAITQVMDTKLGGPFSQLILDQDLRKVWKMGYFEDVQVAASDSEGGKLVTVKVKEKPSVSRVQVVGATHLDAKDIQDQIGIKPFSIFKPGEIKDAEQKVLKLYRDKGYYDATVSTQVNRLEKGDVGLVFNINEGQKVFIEDVTFTGNKAFGDSDLRDIIKTHGSGWFTWWTESNVLERATLDQDLQTLSDYYFNHGYMEAKVGEPTVERKPGGLVISVPIEEGPRYKVGKLDVGGELLKPQEELVADFKTKSGDWYNRDDLRLDVTALHELYADQGFAYVDVRPDVKRDRTNHTVDVSLKITKGQKIYFERIIITGNTRTRDKVIRRELLVAEGDLYSASALRKANMRLHRLNFFEDVHIEQSKGTDLDKMNLAVAVKEKRTGSISAGGGYSTQDGPMIMGQISENNLFGRGQQLSLTGRLGGKGTRYQVSFTEPWLFDMPISAGVDVYDWRREYITYDKEAIGTRFRFGFPTPWQFTRLGLYYKFEWAEVSGVDDNASPIIKDQEGDYTTSAVRAMLRRDSRDDQFNASEGSDNSVSAEYAGNILGGTNSFLTLEAESGWYFPLWFKHVFVAHGRIGWQTELEDGRLPMYEKFFLGGINTLRGFEYQSVAPKAPGTNDPIGGERMFQGNLEYRFPLLPQAGVIGVLFFDTGNVWTEDDGYQFGDLRKSVGGGIRWFSPLGPLRLEYGYVLDPEPDEDGSAWEFSVGSLF